MKFYNREDEMTLLKSYYSLKNKKSVFIVIAGRRRIGKTRLVRESLKQQKYLDFFVSIKEKGLLLNEFSQEIKQKLGYSPEFRSFEEFLSYIFNTQDNLIISFDEFQNIDKIDRSFISSLQKYWDRFKDTKHFVIIVTGSYIGMIKKIFQNKKAPLYGRADCFLKLQPLSYKISLEIMDDLGIKDKRCKIQLYGILGGIPRYYEFLENIPDLSKKNVLEIIHELFLNKNSMLPFEGKNMLVEEFGKRYRIYFSINESISRGKNTLTDIANAIYQKPTTIPKHLLALEDYFEIIKRTYPVTDKISKKSRYMINDYFLLFWFYFIYKNIRYFEEDTREYVSREISEKMSVYFGPVFEQISKEFLINLNKHDELTFSFDKIDQWWGYYREDNIRMNLEIDLIALNENTKEIGFFECKWQDLNTERALKILEELKRKAGYVEWNNNKRKEYFGLIGRKIRDKSNLREKGFLVFDLDDF